MKRFKYVAIKKKLDPGSSIGWLYGLQIYVPRLYDICIQYFELWSVYIMFINVVINLNYCKYCVYK